MRKFLIEFKSRELFDYPSEKIFEADGQDGSHLTNTVSITADGKKTIQTWILTHPNQVTLKKSLKLRLYSQPELSNMFQSVGFSNLISYGDWNGSSFTSNSKRLIMIGSK